MIHILIDIEATGRLPNSMIVIGIAINNDGKKSKHVFYLPEDGVDVKSPSTTEWINSDPNIRAYFEKALDEGKNNSRELIAHAIRQIYEELKQEGKQIVLWGDFTVFDYGFVNSLLEKYNLLPIYMESDSSCPDEIVDYTTYIKGLAGLYPWESSKEAFKILGIERQQNSANHDTEIDIDIMMNNVMNILDFVSEIKVNETKRLKTYL